MAVRPRSELLSTVCSVVGLVFMSGIANANASGIVIEFGPDNTLFAANSATNTITAYALGDLPNAAGSTESAGYNLIDFGTQVSAFLGVPLSKISFDDLAVHPVTKVAYLSVSYSHGTTSGFALLTVDQSGEIVALDLDALGQTSTVLDNTPSDGVTFWEDIPASTLTVTDLDFFNGSLFVSGLSTGEFASTLRQIRYPFDGDNISSSVEIFHAVHNQMETRAPIRAMTIMDVAGTPTIVAAYACTPLATMPVSDFTDGAHVVGKTIAELGYGNTPVEVLSYQTYDMEGNASPVVLVLNREIDADLIALDDLENAVAGPALSSQVPLGASAGVATMSLPLSGVVQADDQDAQFILTLRRNLDNGDMELASFRKGAYFRLSDHISEYNFPDYIYAETEEADFTRKFQNMLKLDEGFESQLR